MAISHTMQFRRICCDWMASAMRSVALGGTHCCVEVNGTGSTGLVSIASPVSTSRHAGFCIPTRRSVSSRHDLRQEPYAVALHVRICAGGSAMAVPCMRILNALTPCHRRLPGRCGLQNPHDCASSRSKANPSAEPFRSVAFGKSALPAWTQES